MIEYLDIPSRQPQVVGQLRQVREALPVTEPPREPDAREAGHAELVLEWQPDQARPDGQPQFVRELKDAQHVQRRDAYGAALTVELGAVDVVAKEHRSGERPQIEIKAPHAKLGAHRPG